VFAWVETKIHTWAGIIPLIFKYSYELNPLSTGRDRPSAFEVRRPEGPSTHFFFGQGDGELWGPARPPESAPEVIPRRRGATSCVFELVGRGWQFRWLEA